MAAAPAAAHGRRGPAAALAALCCAIAATGDACTTIGVTRGASADGSTMVTHTSDCAQCDSRVAYIPARHWPAGAMRPIYTAKLEYPREVSNRSETYLPAPGQEWSRAVGFVPEVSDTYAYWEAVYGYMNEHGLALGESTTAGNFPVSQRGSALLWIRPLTQMAMERCRTARCAIDTMGALAEVHGFYGEDAGASGAGEALVVADGKEVWVFHITGDATGTSAFWVAQRVPDGHVVAVANNFVIRQVDCEYQDNYRCSTDLLSKAKAIGASSGEGALDFARAMGPDIRNFSYTPGYSPIPMYTTARLWRVFSRVAPSLGLRLTDNPYDVPFSVKSERRLSHRHLMDLKRDHYEGTEIDLTVGPMAGPFGSPNRLEGGEGLKVTRGQFARAISLPRTSYCCIGHSFGEESGAKHFNKWWYASDSPASSVFVPFYTGAWEFAAAYRIGHMSKYDDRSAWWVFDFVANWMDINYRLMSIDVRKKLSEWQDRVDRECEEHEARAVGSDNPHLLFGEFQAALQSKVVDAWRGFGHHLIMKYNDGRINYPEIAQPIGYPAWWLQTFGVDSDIFPKWGRPSDSPPTLYELCGPGPFAKCSPQDLDLGELAAGEDVAAPPRASVPLYEVAVLLVAGQAVTFLLGWLLGSGRLALPGLVRGSTWRGPPLSARAAGGAALGDSCPYVAA